MLFVRGEGGVWGVVRVELKRSVGNWKWRRRSEERSAMREVRKKERLRKARVYVLGSEREAVK